LPQALKDAGYATLMVGKWHLGNSDRKYWPQDQGFDYFYGNVSGEVDYFSHERGGLIAWQHNGEFPKQQGYYMDPIGDDAVRLIDQQDAKTRFFLYFASLAPHAPYQVTQNYKDLYPSVADKTQQAHYGMISSLDHEVGRIVEELEKKHLRDNTIILFASDNGGATTTRRTKARSNRGQERRRRTRLSGAARAAFTKAACASQPSPTGPASGSRESSTSPCIWSK